MFALFEALGTLSAVSQYAYFAPLSDPLVAGCKRHHAGSIYALGSLVEGFPDYDPHVPEEVKAAFKQWCTLFVDCVQDPQCCTSVRYSLFY